VTGRVPSLNTGSANSTTAFPLCDDSLTVIGAGHTRVTKAESGPTGNVDSGVGSVVGSVGVGSGVGSGCRPGGVGLGCCPGGVGLGAGSGVGSGAGSVVGAGSPGAATTTFEVHDAFC